MEGIFAAVKLRSIPTALKMFILAFLFLLTSGVTTGLFYLYQTTEMSATGTAEHYRGSGRADADFPEIREKYPKSLAEMLLTTHNHWIGFSFIFFLLGGVFYFSSIVTDRLKYILMTESFVSVWLTFASIWAMRFIDPLFVYLSIVTAVITYVTFYLMIVLIAWELIFVRRDIG